MARFQRLVNFLHGRETDMKICNYCKHSKGELVQHDRFPEYREWCDKGLKSDKLDEKIKQIPIDVLLMFVKCEKFDRS